MKSLGFLCVGVLLLVVCFVVVGLGAEHTVSVQRRKALCEVLFDLQEPLRESQVPFFLDFGTALGQVRERDVILGDIDVDIGVCVHHKTEEEVVYDTLKRHLSDRYDIQLREDLIQLFQKRQRNNISIDRQVITDGRSTTCRRLRKYCFRFNTSPYGIVWKSYPYPHKLMSFS